MTYKFSLLFVCCLIGVSLSAPLNDEVPCNEKRIDLLFAVDANLGMKGLDLEILLDFVYNTIHNFEVNPYDSRIGIVSYGAEARIELPLDSYYDSLTVMKAFSRIESAAADKKESRTDLVFRVARKIFEKAERKGVAKAIILITDGSSQYSNLAKYEAITTKQQEIEVITIGIGRDIDNVELHTFASTHNNAFPIKSYRGFEYIKSAVIDALCRIEVDVTQFITTPSPFAKTCEGKPADVVFTLDGSGSIYNPDFRKQLQFVQNMVSIFEIAPDKVRIGCQTFGDRPYHQFQLDTYKTEDEVKRAIGHIEQWRGNTNTGDALRDLRDVFFSANKVRKDDIAKIAIVITDGKSDKPEITAMQAKITKASGVLVFAIGVGDSFDEKELQIIATDPTFVFEVSNYTMLDSIKGLLAMKACDVSAPAKVTTEFMPADTGCTDNQPADVVFTLPANASANQAKDTLDFINQLASGFNEENDNGAVRFGLTPKTCFAVPGFHLKESESMSNVMEIIGEQREGMSQSTAQLLKYMRKDMFTERNGARPGAKRVGIVIIDQESQDMSQLLAEAREAKLAGITLFVIGIGRDLPREQLQAIASHPSDIHTFQIDNYDQLSSLTDEIMDAIHKACDSVPKWPQM